MEESNQPAFARNQILDGKIIEYGGLTKREYFAGLIMQGMLANPSSNNQLKDQHTPFTVQMAEASIILADELLKQLSRSQ